MNYEWLELQPKNLGQGMIPPLTIIIYDVNCKFSQMLFIKLLKFSFISSLLKAF